MDRRIFGIETEFGVTCAFEGQRKLSPDEVARYLFRKVVSWGRSSNVFLRNGSRLYLDVGLAPGVRHPRVRRPRPAGRRTTAPGSASSRASWSTPSAGCTRRASPARSSCSRTTPTPPATPTAATRTTSFSRHGEFARLSDVLIPFLVTRQLIAGAGKVLQTPRGAVFCFSQRADHIWEGVSSATTRSRPIINTRDEPHADAENLPAAARDRGRLQHVRDHGAAQGRQHRPRAADDRGRRRHARHTLENPIRAIREISHDLTGRRLVRLANGREVTALEIQQEYLDRAKDFVDAHGAAHPTSSSGCWTCGSGRCARSARGDLGAVDREIDWVIKQRLDGAVPRQARPAAVVAADRAAGPGLPRHPPRPRPVLPARQRAGWSSGSRRTRGLQGDRASRRRPPGPSCAATSSAGRRSAAATTPWTGCI